MKILIITVFLFVLSAHVNAFGIELEGSDTIRFMSDKGNKIIALDTVVNGYNVKCDGSVAIFWGKPKIINEGNPQDTNIILIDIMHDYRMYEVGVSDGVFEVDYLKKKGYAYIGNNQGVFMDLYNGHLENIGSEFDPSDENNFEKCNKNKSWVFNRYGN